MFKFTIAVDEIANLWIGNSLKGQCTTRQARGYAPVNRLGHGRSRTGAGAGFQQRLHSAEASCSTESAELRSACSRACVNVRSESCIWGVHAVSSYLWLSIARLLTSDECKCTRSFMSSVCRDVRWADSSSGEPRGAPGGCTHMRNTWRRQTCQELQTQYCKAKISYWAAHIMQYADLFVYVGRASTELFAKLLTATESTLNLQTPIGDARPRPHQFPIEHKAVVA